MGYDVALIGSLSFPAGKLEAWLADDVDASGEDWPAGMRGDGRAPGPVREVLESLAGEVPGAPVHIVAGKQKLELRVLLHEDAFHDAAARVAKAFELAGAHGGDGALDLLGYLTSDLALRVLPSTRAKKLAAKEAARARRAKAYVWIEEAVETGVEPRVELPRAKVAPKQKTSKVSASPISREAAIARLLRPYRVGADVRWMVTTRHVPLTLEELLPLLDDPAILDRAPNRLEITSERTCARRRGKSFALGAAGAAALAAHPALAGFEELVLAGAGVGDTGVEALAASPHAQGLRSLDLGEAGVGDDGIAALGRLRDLRSLRIDGNKCKASALIKLAEAGLPALERLDLPADASAKAIVALARAATKLRAFSINYATLDDDACRAVSELPLERLRVFAPKTFAASALGPMPQLRSFAYDPNIGGKKLALDGLLALGRAMSSLRTLDVSTGSFGAAELQAIASGFGGRLRRLAIDSHSRDGAALFSTELPELEALELVNVVCDDDAIAALVRAAPRLREVYLRDSTFGARGAASLAGSGVTTLRLSGVPLVDVVPDLAPSRALTSLSLDAPAMSPGVAKALVGSALTTLILGWRTKTEVAALPFLLTLPLRKLEITNTTLGADGARAIAAGSAPLESLILHGCKLGPEGAQILANAPSLAGLRRLDLTVNAIGDGGARALAESPCLGELRRLNVENCNGITLEGASALANSQNLASLETLLVFSNDVPLDKPVDAPPHRVVAQQLVYPSTHDADAGATYWELEPGWRWRSSPDERL